MFTKILEELTSRTPGVLGAVVMGLDGIAVQVSQVAASPSLEDMGMEYSFLLSKIANAGKNFESGSMQDMMITYEQVNVVARMLDEEYFLAVALGKGGNLGKCRYLTKIAASKIKEIL